MGFKKNILRPALIASIIALFAFPFTAIYPILSPEQIEKKSQRFKSLGLLRWEDGKDHTLPQDFADMLGWKELAEKVISVFDTIPNKNNTLIFCANYGEAGAINYYARGRIPKAVSFNADYIFWIPKNLEVKNIIQVQEANDTISKKEKSFFKTVKSVTKIENTYAREYGTTVFVLLNADSMFNKFLYDKMEEREKSYSLY